MIKSKQIKQKKGKGSKGPYKKEIALIYALWRSMPFIFHEMGLQRLAGIGCDVEDETFKKLVSCKTKTQFMEAFKIHSQALAEWDKSEVVQKMIDDFNIQSNVLKFKKDVDFHFTQKTIKESDAARVKLWKQIFEGWVETSKTELDGKLKFGHVVDLGAKTRKLMDDFIKDRKNKI